MDREMSTRVAQQQDFGCVTRAVVSEKVDFEKKLYLSGGVNTL